MNFLAHLYISRNHEQLSVGNFIADYVKGNNLNRYSPEIADGIRLHRTIDELTDNNPDYREVRRLFVVSHGKYSRVVADIVYDYVLASGWEAYERDVSLAQFQQKTNSLLLQNFSVLPLGVKLIIPFFVRNRWFVIYSQRDNLPRVLNGMIRFRGISGNADMALTILSEHEQQVRKAFELTFQKVSHEIKARFPLYSI